MFLLSKPKMNIFVDVSAIEAQNLAAIARRSKSNISLDPHLSFVIYFQSTEPSFIRKKSARAEAEVQAGCHGHWHQIKKKKKGGGLCRRIWKALSLFERPINEHISDIFIKERGCCPESTLRAFNHTFCLVLLQKKTEQESQNVIVLSSEETL